MKVPSNYYHFKCNTSTVDVTSVWFHLVNSQSPLFGFEKSPLSGNIWILNLGYLYSVQNINLPCFSNDYHFQAQPQWAFHQEAQFRDLRQKC